MKILSSLVIIFSAFAQTSCQSNAAFEASQTKKLLGVEVKQFPHPQGVINFDEIPGGAAQFKFKIVIGPLTGPTPKPSYETRSIVTAQAPDGTVYEAFCGRFDPSQVSSSSGESSSNMNPRQRYVTHLGYGFNPADVFIGKREGGKIKTSLFFRDVGSHETAPHHITVDNKGKVHLTIADANISDDNKLELYSIIGDPISGKWSEAWLLDRRGFTSRSHPWSGAWGDIVHQLWDWGDATNDKESRNMGLFYVNWNPPGFGRKVRVISGLIESYDAGVDPKTGLLLIVATRNDGIFVSSRDAKGNWTKPTRLDSALKKGDVSVTTTSVGTFIVRTSWEESRELLLTPDENS